MYDGTQVSVSTDGDQIRRELNLDGADFPLETEVYEVNMSQAERARDAVLNDLGPKKQSAEHVLKILEANPNADYSEIQEQLQASLGSDAYQELGLDAYDNIAAASQHLKSLVERYDSEIAQALDRFRGEAREEIRAVRESYERQDEELKITLQAIKNSGLGRLGLDWIAAELTSGSLMPDIGVGFDA